VSESESGGPLRVLGYARVSTGEQSESGLGLASQAAAIESVCTRNGWHLIETITDRGLSGKDLNREGLRSALVRIAAGEANGLVAAKLDRVSRSLIDVIALVEWFASAGAVLVAEDIGLNTATPAGRLVVSIMAAVAEWERGTIRDRTRTALAARRSSGGRVSRTAVRDVRPDIAARIEAQRASGATWQKIADSLNDDGIPTVRGGIKWRVSSVQSAAGYRRPPARQKPSDLPSIPSRNRKTVRSA